MAREKKSGRRIPWRIWLALVALALAAAGSAAAALKLRAYALADPDFTFSRDHKDAFAVQGLVYASRAKVERIFAADFGHSIFAVPLGERRRRLLAIDWIEDASVSRIWPDRLSVRVHERKPVAFVGFRSGVLLIDRQGVFLDPPRQANFTFPVLSGIREDESDADRREAVRILLGFENDMGYLFKDVSEVDVSDPDNIRIVAQVNNRPVDLTMGGENFAKRYQNFVSHYPEIMKHSPDVRKFDLQLDDRITAKE